MTTNFETIYLMIWRLLSKCQVKWEIASNFCGLFSMSEFNLCHPLITYNKLLTVLDYSLMTFYLLFTDALIYVLCHMKCHRKRCCHETPWLSVSMLSAFTRYLILWLLSVTSATTPIQQTCWWPHLFEMCWVPRHWQKFFLNVRPSATLWSTSWMRPPAPGASK